jgi:hypothetical protein
MHFTNPDVNATYMCKKLEVKITVKIVRLINFKTVVKHNQKELLMEMYPERNESSSDPVFNIHFHKEYRLLGCGAV